MFSKNVPHILEKTFFFLDYESYKNCLEVSSEWKGVLTSERYISKGKLVFKKNIVEDEKKLCIAAKQGNTNGVRMLLASGMVNANRKVADRPRRYQTPLHHAALGGHKEIAELLIEYGADPNVAANCGTTPLHYAAWHGRKGVTEILIECGADPNAADNDGKTPLHKAALKGYREVAKLLMEKGADMDRADKNGKTPRQYMDEEDVDSSDSMDEYLSDSGDDYEIDSDDQESFEELLARLEGAGVKFA